MAPIATGGLYNDREQLLLTLVDHPGQALDLSFTVRADGNELLERGEVPPGKRHQQVRERGRRMERCIDHLLEQGCVLLRELDDHSQEMLASLLYLTGEGDKFGVRLLRGFQQACRQRLFALQSQAHDEGAERLVSQRKPRQQVQQRAGAIAPLEHRFHVVVQRWLMIHGATDQRLPCQPILEQAPHQVDQEHSRLLFIDGGAHALYEKRPFLIQVMPIVSELPVASDSISMLHGFLDQGVEQRFIMQRRPYLVPEKGVVAHGCRQQQCPQFLCGMLNT